MVIFNSYVSHYQRVHPSLYLSIEKTHLRNVVTVFPLAEFFPFGVAEVVVGCCVWVKIGWYET